MKKICLILILLLSRALFYAQPLSITPTTIQQPIQVYESSLFDPKMPDKGALKNGGIVEINGQLLVHLNRDQIRDRMVEIAGSSQPDFRLLDKYKYILQVKDDLMSKVREGLAYTQTGAPPDFDKLADLSKGLGDFLTTIISDTLLQNEAGIAFDEFSRKQADGSLSPAYDMNLYLLEHFAKVAADALDRLETPDHVKFILAGSIRSGRSAQIPIHLSDAFDQNPAKVYVVPRWVFSLSEDQKKELKGIAELSGKLEAKRHTNLVQARDAVSQPTKSQSLMDTLKMELKAAPKYAEAFGDSVKNKAISVFKPLYEQVKDIQNRFLKTHVEGAKLSSAEELISFNNENTELIGIIEGLYKNLPGEFQKLPKELLALPEIRHVREIAERGLEKLKGDVKTALAVYESLRMIIVGSGQDKRLDNTINDKVKRLNYNDIPKESTIDLTQTGERKNGDILSLQAYVQMDNGSGAAPLQSIYKQTIILQQIAMYSEVAVNMILARPLVPDVKATHKFLFAPAYSVLFRWGSRKSKFYNDFVNVGVGLNFSAPDFNFDGVPEFAVAGAVSAFKDYLEIGYGYNFGHDGWFWFLGFRIPFASASLPVLNSVVK